LQIARAHVDLSYHVQIPEELTLDYAEITSIPPLPLWTLLAADKETISSQQKEEVKVKLRIVMMNEWES